MSYPGSHTAWGRIGAPHSRKRRKWLSKISRKTRFKQNNRASAHCDIPVKTILRKRGIKEGDEGAKDGFQTIDFDFSRDPGIPSVEGSPGETKKYSLKFGFFGEDITIDQEEKSSSE